MRHISMTNFPVWFCCFFKFVLSFLAKIESIPPFMYDFIYSTSWFSFEGFLINRSNLKRRFNCEIIARWVGLLVQWPGRQNYSRDLICVLIARRLTLKRHWVSFFILIYSQSSDLYAWHMVGDVFSALFLYCENTGKCRTWKAPSAEVFLKPSQM